MPTETGDFLAEGEGVSLVQKTTANTLIIHKMRRESFDAQDYNTQDEHSAEMSDTCEIGVDTYQDIVGVGADNEGSALAGFINAEPNVHQQEVENVYADGRGAVAKAGVVHDFDRQEFQRTPPARGLVRRQKISDVRATTGGSAFAGYINPMEHDYKDKQKIQRVTADRRGLAVAGVARNFVHHQRTVIGDSRNDGGLQNQVQDAGHRADTAGDSR